ncbi:hypothetical protein CFIMG_006217RA [Ceratocystis fimbriata CBS 114723]|uniref:TECPR1-like DysF domain-containing protein n=1 Tax=Ceratocystis fimbriata CBS 114723 TaxID=1035309 RepID=A0A2C5WVF0_9PEZI|nr:hypothetical protein CFIMG_006217RA [Ceratocystis fimbriata CBS 114723]
MDEFTADLFVSRDPSPDGEHAPLRVCDKDRYQQQRQDSPHVGGHNDKPSRQKTSPSKSSNIVPVAPAPQPRAQETKGGGFRQRIAALRDKASLQDRFLETILAQIVPEDDPAAASRPPVPQTTGMEFYENRPNFNITTMSNNFRRFNARIGVVFKFQEQVIRILTWQRYSHTLSVLAVYSFVCLDPHLLPILPLAVLMLGVFIPGFLARHPAPPRGPGPLTYSPGGPPIAPAHTAKPAKELSRDFLQNMRDLQNCMDDFCVGHDQVVSTIVPITNFSDEAHSSAIFVFMFAASVLMSISAHLLPWRLLFLAGGWAVFGMHHPRIAALLEATRRTHAESQEALAKRWLDTWIRHDIILDSAPETREVEVFELQRMIAGSSEWEPWLFSPSPYDPLSQPRLAAERPRGTRFFEDVLPPEGWEWSEKKWALDLWSREWVEERIITGVEVETEGERWVYDMPSATSTADAKMDPTGVAPPSYGDDNGSIASSLVALEPLQSVTGDTLQAKTGLDAWDEGEGVVQHGEWRRRRWVRIVKRQQQLEEA